MRIPRTMSTQHPDNATTPFFASHSVLQGEDEIKEAYYAFSNLGAEEIMWDAEGKESDDFVVRKLLTDYSAYFLKNRIGKDAFITIRTPNPKYEKTEAKVLLETLESIPRSYDTAKAFYGNGKHAPIFEVIVPMADYEVTEKIYHYYKNVVSGKETLRFMDRRAETVGQWIGAFKPKTVNVIPLFEDIHSMLDADKTVAKFIKGKNLDHQRVFLARSDPAMNYSSLAVILALHLTLEKLHALEKKTGVEIHPILGSGSAPFRGHLTPRTVDYILRKYPSVSTYSIQSAFKYDFPVREVQQAIDKINRTPRTKPIPVEDPKEAMRIIRKIIPEYQRQVQALAPLINELAKFVPGRRMRKLHTGLFGYSRALKKGVSLPRVISFCAALYSIGLPPDLLGLSALSKKERKYVEQIYPRFEKSQREILSLWNPKVLKLLPAGIQKAVEKAAAQSDYKPNREHLEASNEIIACFQKKNLGADITKAITQAGLARGFLG